MKKEVRKMLLRQQKEARKQLDKSQSFMKFWSGIVGRERLKIDIKKHV